MLSIFHSASECKLETLPLPISSIFPSALSLTALLPEWDTAQQHMEDISNISQPTRIQDVVKLN